MSSPSSTPKRRILRVDLFSHRRIPGLHPARVWSFTFSRVTKDAFHRFSANLAESENDRDDGFRAHSTRPLAQTIAYVVDVLPELKVGGKLHSGHR